MAFIWGYYIKKIWRNQSMETRLKIAMLKWYPDLPWTYELITDVYIYIYIKSRFILSIPWKIALRLIWQDFHDD